MVKLGGWRIERDREKARYQEEGRSGGETESEREKRAKEDDVHENSQQAKKESCGGLEKEGPTNASSRGPASPVRVGRNNGAGAARSKWEGAIQERIGALAVWQEAAFYCVLISDVKSASARCVPACSVELLPVTPAWKCKNAALERRGWLVTL